MKLVEAFIKNDAVWAKLLVIALVANDELTLVLDDKDELAQDDDIDDLELDANDADVEKIDALAQDADVANCVAFCNGAQDAEIAVEDERALSD